MELLVFCASCGTEGGVSINLCDFFCISGLVIFNLGGPMPRLKSVPAQPHASTLSRENRDNRSLSDSMRFPQHNVETLTNVSSHSARKRDKPGPGVQAEDETYLQ